MSEALVWFFAIALAASTALWVLGGVAGRIRRLVGDDARYRRLLGRLEPTPIARAPEGKPVKIVGKIVPVEPPFAGALTAKPSICAVTTISQPMGGLTILRKARWVAAFAVEDATGSVVVRPDGAHLHLEVDAALYSGGVDDPPPSETMKQLLASEGRRAEQLLRLRYTEASLEPSQTVSVYGVVRFEVHAGGAGGYREAATQRLLVASQRAPLLISNAPSALQPARAGRLTTSRATSAGSAPPPPVDRSR